MTILHEADGVGARQALPLRWIKQHRLRIIHAGILATFALIPVWYRFTSVPPLFPPLYVSNFLILLPMLFTITAWLIMGVPGLRDLRRSRWGRGWTLALLLLTLWAFASTLWAFQRRNYPEVGQTAALQFGIVALFAVVCACAAPRPRHIVATMAVVCALNGLITVGQVWNMGALGLRGLGEFSYSAESNWISILRAGDLTYVRPYGLMPHPNALAGTLMVGVLAACAWVISARRGRWLAGVGIVTLGGWALLLTFSRAAWIAVALGVVLLLPFARPLITRRALLVMGTVGLVGALFFISYRPFLAARVGVGDGQEAIELRSISDRLVFTDFALRSIAERPIFGVGIGNFPWRASYFIVGTHYDLRGDNVHHVLLSAWAELGTVGLVLVLLALIFAALAIGQRLRDRTVPHEDRAGLIALAAITVALIVVGFFDHYPWTMVQMQTAWWGLMGAALAQKQAPPAR